MARRVKDIRSYDSHRFFCMKCGMENFTIPRKGNQKHEKFHRKKLYCWHCQCEVNNIECRNQEEVDEFRENFAKGMYVDECEESLRAIRSTSEWKKLLGKK